MLHYEFYNSILKSRFINYSSCSQQFSNFKKSNESNDYAIYVLI